MQIFGVYRYIVEYRTAAGSIETATYYAGDNNELTAIFYKEHFHTDFSITYKAPYYGED